MPGRFAPLFPAAVSASTRSASHRPTWQLGIRPGCPAPARCGKNSATGAWHAMAPARLSPPSRASPTCPFICVSAPSRYANWYAAPSPRIDDLAERADLARFLLHDPRPFPAGRRPCLQAGIRCHPLGRAPRLACRLAGRAHRLPLVDAAMRQLNHSGWMHNRLRMVVASFLTKDLGLDWRLGERWFAEELNDFDLSANNGGWQWASSSGCDAQPYFRIFNPVTQSENSTQKASSSAAMYRNWPPCRTNTSMPLADGAHRAGSARRHHRPRLSGADCRSCRGPRKRWRVTRWSRNRMAERKRRFPPQGNHLRRPIQVSAGAWPGCIRRPDRATRLRRKVCRGSDWHPISSA